MPQREARYGGAEGDENQTQAQAEAGRFADSVLVEDTPDLDYWWRGGIVPASRYVIDMCKERFASIPAEDMCRAARVCAWRPLQQWIDLCLRVVKAGETQLFRCPKKHTEATECVGCDQITGCPARLTEFPHAYGENQRLRDNFTNKLVQRFMRGEKLPK